MNLSEPSHIQTSMTNPPTTSNNAREKNARKGKKTVSDLPPIDNSTPERNPFPATDARVSSIIPGMVTKKDQGHSR